MNEWYLDTLIRKCPTIKRNVNYDCKILSPDIAGLRGNDTRKKARYGQNGRHKMQFTQNHKFITFTADLMFANSLVSFITVSQGISPIALEFVANRKHNLGLR